MPAVYEVWFKSEVQLHMGNHCTYYIETSTEKRKKQNITVSFQFLFFLVLFYIYVCKYVDSKEY